MDRVVAGAEDGAISWRVWAPPRDEVAERGPVPDLADIFRFDVAATVARERFGKFFGMLYFQSNRNWMSRENNGHKRAEGP